MQYGWKLHHKKKRMRFWSDPKKDTNVYDEVRAIRIQEARNQLINKLGENKNDNNRREAGPVSGIPQPEG